MNFAPLPPSEKSRVHQGGKGTELKKDGRTGKGWRSERENSETS